SLTRTIHELRRALGDDSSQPRFIETIPKRGYRFVAPVQSRTLNRNKMIIERHLLARVTTREEEVSEADQPAGAQALPATTARRRRRRLRMAGAAMSLALVAGAALWVVYIRKGSAPRTDRRPPRGGLMRLTDNAAADLSPKWSPDGSKIAFHSNRDGKYKIYV